MLMISQFIQEALACVDIQDPEIHVKSCSVSLYLGPYHGMGPFVPVQNIPATRSPRSYSLNKSIEIPVRLPVHLDYLEQRGDGDRISAGCIGGWNNPR